jgi:hypothetical protein
MRFKSSGILISLLALALVSALASPLFAETVVVPFTGGASAASTTLAYSGDVWITVSGTGSISTPGPLNDAFYVFTDAAGVPITPFYPDPNTTPDSGILWINGAAAQFSIPGWSGAPAYSSLNEYSFLANVAAGPIVFGAGDSVPADDTGSFTVDIAMPAMIAISPNTLNLRSRGRWITAFIQLPADLDPRNILRSSLLLDGIVPAAPRPYSFGDHSGDGIRELMIKFSRSATQALLTPGTNTITITGDMVDGTSFIGSTTLRVINPGKGKNK